MSFFDLFVRASVVVGVVPVAAVDSIARIMASTLAVLEAFGIYIAIKVGDRVLDSLLDEVTGSLIDWSRRVLKRSNPNSRRSNTKRGSSKDEPPKNTFVILGPNNKPLGRIKVTEDDVIETEDLEEG